MRLCVLFDDVKCGSSENGIPFQSVERFGNTGEPIKNSFGSCFGGRGRVAHGICDADDRVAVSGKRTAEKDLDQTCDGGTAGVGCVGIAVRGNRGARKRRKDRDNAKKHSQPFFHGITNFPFVVIKYTKLFRRLQGAKRVFASFFQKPNADSPKKEESRVRLWQAANNKGGSPRAALPPPHKRCRGSCRDERNAPFSLCRKKTVDSGRMRGV